MYVIHSDPHVDLARATHRDRDILRHKMRSADCILVLFDVTRPATKLSVTTLWLPMIEDMFAGQRDKGVMVVAAKCDLKEDYVHTDTERIEVMDKYPFVLQHLW